MAHSSGLKGNSVGMLKTARENTAEWASHKISKLSLFWSNKEYPPPQKIKLASPDFKTLNLILIVLA
jgi:hypothetical protein